VIDLPGMALPVTWVATVSGQCLNLSHKVSILSALGDRRSAGSSRRTFDRTICRGRRQQAFPSIPEPYAPPLEDPACG